MIDPAKAPERPHPSLTARRRSGFWSRLSMAARIRLDRLCIYSQRESRKDWQAGSGELAERHPRGTWQQGSNIRLQ